MYAYTCICICIYIYACICMYMYVYVCIYVCMHVCMYACMHAYVCMRLSAGLKILWGQFAFYPVRCRKCDPSRRSHRRVRRGSQLPTTGDMPVGRGR